jgi:thioredoxin reductase
VEKTMPGILQVVIVGAGPAGLAATVAAKAMNLTHQTVEQDSIGGTILHYPRNKIVMTKAMQLPIYGKINVSSLRKEDLLDVWKDIIAKTGIEVRTGVKVDGVVRGDDGIFDVTTSAGSIRTQAVVLAVGRRGTPRKLGVNGEEQGKVAYRLIEPDDYAGKACLVVGGGDSAVEAAVALGEVGATTHLSYRREVFARIKPKNQERLDAAIAARRVVPLLPSTVQRIGKDDVSLKMGDEEQVITNDYVFVFVGGVLPTEFLRNAGVEISTYRGEVFTPANT